MISFCRRRVLKNGRQNGRLPLSDDQTKKCTSVKLLSIFESHIIGLISQFRLQHQAIAALTEFWLNPKHPPPRFAAVP